MIFYVCVSVISSGDSFREVGLKYKIVEAQNISQQNSVTARKMLVTIILQLAAGKIITWWYGVHTVPTLSNHVVIFSNQTEDLHPV